MNAPPGLPDRIWLVVTSDGEKHFITREPPEGVVAWADGTDATVIVYGFAGVVRTPPAKKKDCKS